MRKTSTLLSDARELIYFDDDTRAPRSARDLRGLSPIKTTSELRYDPMLETWVTIASHRQDRTYLPADDACPFCPSKPDRLTEIPESGYDVVVFENRFPAYSSAADWETPLQDEPYVTREGIGRCEVICFTPDHDASFADLSPSHARLVLEAWVDRTAALMRQPGVMQVYCFENRGREIGVTEKHPHGQIYGYPFVTHRTERMLSALAHYNARTGSNLFDDILAKERSEKSRIVNSGKHWSAFVPRAARWPFEVHCYPHRRVPDLSALNDRERVEFCEIYLDILRRFDALFGTPIPYVSGIHQAPKGAEAGFALHLEIFTTRRAANKLKYLAGSESGMDAFISDVEPEAAAARLRAAL